MRRALEGRQQHLYRYRQTYKLAKKEDKKEGIDTMEFEEVEE